MDEIKKTEEKEIEPDDVLPEISFKNSAPKMRDACDRAGWKQPHARAGKINSLFLAGG